MKINMILGILLVIALIGLAGCKQVPPVFSPQGGGTGNGGTAGNQGQVVVTTGSFQELQVFDPTMELGAKSFKSITEFNDFVKKNAQGGYASGGMYINAMVKTSGARSDMLISESAAAPAAAQDIANSGSGDGGSNEFSQTNNQVAGIDEADIIKTDGSYIYTVSGNTLFIVKAYPGEDAKIVSTIKFDSQPTSLFINGNNLAVFGNFYNLDFFKEIDFVPRQGMTYFNIYDISNKEEPELVKDYKFEGNYFEARMMNDYVYFVTTTGPEYRIDYPTPLMVLGNVKTMMPVKDIYYYPIPYQSVQFANIHAINMENLDEDVNSKSIAVEGSQNMYMSENNIYITYTEYINEYELAQKITIDLMMDQLTDADKLTIEKIKQTDDDVLSQQEKEQKILQIVQTYVNYMTQNDRDDFEKEMESALKIELEKYKYMEYTIINKVSVDNGQISIAANGKVSGHIMNQFSMDEHNNVFRIATTISPRWSSFISSDNTENQQKLSTNNVYTLDENLELLDELTGLAEGEQIYSTRFMGDRLYMVTFRQVDPFFVIDLSNPNNIKSLGKLKIPGFSRYLHPYDANTIIGIGRDVSEVTGETKGLKISLFDVSDVENPKEVSHFVTAEKYAQSTAEYEHKAFLFDKDKELLVIPAYSYTYRECFRYPCPTTNSGEDYNGAMVFKITKDDIEMRGIIDHSLGKGQYYGSMVERSLFINELLYTKSPGLLRINKLSDLSKVKNIDLESSSGPYPVY